MTLIQELLLYACIALAAFFLMEYLFYHFGDSNKQSESRIKKRLGKINTKEAAEFNLKRTIKNEEGGDFFIDKYYRSLLIGSNSRTSLARLYIIIAAITVFVTFLISFTAPIIPFPAAIFLGVLSGFSLPTFFLKRQITKRRDKFSEQFPDVIELIVRSLRVGQPLSAALQTVAQEMPDPIGTEFQIVAQEIAYGKNVPDALQGMMDRVPLEDLRFFVVAIQIQHDSGGNLAEILEGLSKIVRGRFKLMRKVRALTAEGRFSAWFLSVFPVFMMFVMNVINPGYYHKVSDYAYFTHIVGLVIVMLIINVIAMKIITSIRV